jgi:hypothetical protein
VAYIVTNKTNGTIWWKDGAWTSGEIGPGDQKKVDTDHHANVTIYRGKAHDNKELGLAWFPRHGSVVVYGEWNWDIRPEVG